MASASPAARRMPLGLPHPPGERSLVLIFAAGWAVAGICFWIVREREGGGPLGWAWPLIFWAASAACVAFGARPWSRGLHVLSGGLSFLAVLSRSAAVALNLLYHRGPAGLDPAYAVLGLIVYPLFAIALLYAWDCGLGQLLRRSQIDRGSDRRKVPRASSPSRR